MTNIDDAVFTCDFRITFGGSSGKTPTISWNASKETPVAEEGEEEMPAGELQEAAAGGFVGNSGVDIGGSFIGESLDGGAW